MIKHYTRVCNLFYPCNSKTKLKKKLLQLNGNSNFFFNKIELITRKSKKIINIDKINLQKISVKKKIKEDIKQITKKKTFKGLNFSKTPLIMGVINLTPDSFSDGGKFNSYKQALDLAKKFKKYNCDIIDLGAESTRPGSRKVKIIDEWNRLRRPLKKISKLNQFISVDTRKSLIMNKALKYKINLINDISGLSYDKSTIKFLKKTNIPFVIHHIKGNPSTMQKKPKYKNVVLDIYDYFEKKLKQVRAAGIKHNNIMLDPGIGFGKNLKHNIEIFKKISIFHSLGFPILVGNSRKRFIKEISRQNDSDYRYGGTIASSLYLMTQGIQIIRVHDVNEVKQAIKVYKKLKF